MVALSLHPIKTIPVSYVELFFNVIVDHVDMDEDLSS